MGGRPRTSAAILKLRGSFAKHPERAREDAPGASPWDDTPPETLTGPEQASWREIVRLLPKVAITATERLGVEQMSRLLSQMRVTHTSDPNFTKLDARFCAWAVQMGMTVQARAKLGTSGKQDKPNKFAGLKHEPTDEA